MSTATAVRVTAEQWRLLLCLVGRRTPITAKTVCARARASFDHLAALYRRCDYIEAYRVARTDGGDVDLTVDLDDYTRWPDAVRVRLTTAGFAAARTVWTQNVALTFLRQRARRRALLTKVMTVSLAGIDDLIDLDERGMVEARVDGADHATPLSDVRREDWPHTVLRITALGRRYAYTGRTS